MSENALDELMWAGFLNFALETDPTITEVDIPQMRSDFMAGLRGERMPCEVIPAVRREGNP